jgi:hypothetical protein
MGTRTLKLRTKALIAERRIRGRYMTGFETVYLRPSFMSLNVVFKEIPAF